MVNWHTDLFELQDGATYRISVQVDGRVAGHADVLVVRSGRELRNVDNSEAIPLLDGRTLPIRYRIEEGFGQSSEVPATAPDTVPAWVFARDNLILIDGTSAKVLFPKNVIGVRFKPGTPREDREAAVELVSGSVVGGRPIRGWVEGVYYVRVPGDDTGAAVEEAASRLRGLPQVSDAYTLLMYRPEDASFWRLPSDGKYYRRADWKAKFESVYSADFRPTEAFELIDAPLAWGCETGERSIPIAVIDGEFILHEDLAANVEHAEYSDSVAGAHGFAVAAIIGAVGNNGTGTTGVLWKSQLRLYDYGRDAETGKTLEFPEEVHPYMTIAENVANRVLESGSLGARLINLSIGAPWLGDSELDGMNQDHFADAVADRLRRSLDDLAGAGHQPFLVVAAGNEGQDSRLAGYPLLATESKYSSQVIAVAGLAIDDGHDIQPWSMKPFLDHATNHGRQVEIAAPAIVWTLNKSPDDEEPELFFGTSAAAPFVTGVAGLLLEFDSTLSNKRLKEILIEGAEVSQRSIPNGAGAPAPILNAYNSLKLAAERSGAPLCGNRMWDELGKLKIQRGQTIELAYDFGTSVFGINSFHGGRKIRASTRSNHRLIELMPSGWTEIPDDGGAFDHPESSGSFLSAYGRSHENEKKVLVGRAGSDGWWSICGIRLPGLKLVWHRFTPRVGPLLPRTNALGRSRTCTAFTTPTSNTPTRCA